MTIQVKDLTITELHAFEPLMVMLNNEMQYKHFSPNWDMAAFLADHGMYIMIGAFDAENPIGFVTGTMGRYEYNDSRFAVHSAIYVLPKYRKTSVGARLMRAFESAAKNLGAEYVEWSAHANSEFENLLSNRKFYKKSASVFRRVLTS